MYKLKLEMLTVITFAMMAGANALWKSCDSAVTRMKEGPADFNSVLASDNKYEDESFNGRETIYWFGYDGFEKPP